MARQTSMFISFTLFFCVTCYSQHEGFVDITGYYYPDSVSLEQFPSLHFLELSENRDSAGIYHLFGNILFLPKPDSEQRFAFREAKLDSGYLQFTTSISSSHKFSFLGHFETMDKLYDKQNTQTILEGSLSELRNDTEVRRAKIRFFYSQRAFMPLRLLAPSQIPDLPRGIVTWLDKNGYTIPQPEAGPPCNFTRGEFMKPGQYDWAILSSKDGISSIIVFWNQSLNNPSVIATEPDNHYLEPAPIATLRGRLFNYCRMMWVADSADVNRLLQDRAELTAAQLKALKKSRGANHHGIFNIMDPKGATLYYFLKGVWLEIDAGC